MRVVLLFSFLLLSGVWLPLSAATVVQIGCSLSVPPYVIPNNDRGIILDLLRRSLANAGLSLNLQYSSNHQNANDFNQGKLDGLCRSNIQATPTAFFASAPLITFQNVAISLEERSLPLTTISDLQHYRVQGFSLARQLLPAEFGTAVSNAPLYLEQGDQIEQVRALFAGETDVIVMEKTVFRYFLSQLRRQNPTGPAAAKGYRYAELFPPTDYYSAFRTATLRNQFDQGFEQLRASGEDQRIIKSYEQLLDDYLFR